MNTRMYRNLITLLNYLTNQCLDKYRNKVYFLRNNCISHKVYEK